MHGKGRAGMDLGLGSLGTTLGGIRKPPLEGGDLHLVTRSLTHRTRHAPEAACVDLNVALGTDVMMPAGGLHAGGTR